MTATPFNADAVITWYNSIKEGAPGSQYDATKMLYMADFITAWIDKVEAVDEYTVRLTLPKPYSPLLANLAIPIFRHPQPDRDRSRTRLRAQSLGNRRVQLASPDDWTRDSQIDA